MVEFGKSKALIIDDEEGVVKTVSKLLSRMGIESDSALRLGDGLKKIELNDFDLVFLDVNLPDGNGIDSIPVIMEKNFPPVVIIMTAFSNPDGAELAIESGAWDYIQKPISPKDLKLQVLRSLEFQEQRRQAACFLPFEAPDIIGESAAIRKCLNLASQIISSDANVMITGETGTGKELFAKAIHNNSARRNGNFIVVDCSVLSENLIESVLFGHEKGAFTSADKSRKGLISLANGGTLFLDEVGELPESIQSSFLRVLQEKTFRPVGSENEDFSDFRVICATNKDIEKMVSDRLFRADLLFRLKTFILELPPLRERVEDISLIANDQIQKSCRKHKIQDKSISPDFMEVLEKYDWPGNVRELLNTVETSISAARFEKMLFAYHLPVKLRAQVTRSRLNTGSENNSNILENNSAAEASTHKEFIENAERRYLETAYLNSNEDIQLLMKKTGLSRTVLYRKLNKYNIR